MKKSYLIFGALLSFVLTGCVESGPKPKIQNHSVIELNENAKKYCLVKGLW